MSTRPKIDINSGKFEFIKFIRDNKLSIPITEGGKRRGVKALKEDLEKGGYLIGVKGKSKAPKSRGEKPKQAGLKEQQIQEQEQYAKLTQQFPEGFSAKNINVIKLTGFSATNLPPAQPVSTIQVEYSGYGGMPIAPVVPGSVGFTDPTLREETQVTPSEMRDYLSSRVPVDDFRDLTKPALRELYNKVKQKEGKFIDYSKGQSVEEMRSYLIAAGINIEGLTKQELRMKYNQIEISGKFRDNTDYSKGIPIKQMRDYLSSRLPNTVFKGKTKPEIRQLYNIEKRKENLPVVELEPDTEEEEEEEAQVVEPDLILYEGIQYQELDGKIYDMRGNYVGVWNADFDEINFSEGTLAAQRHERDVRLEQIGEYEPPTRKHPITKEIIQLSESKQQKQREEELRSRKAEEGLIRYRERKEARRIKKEEEEKQRLEELDEEDVDRLLELLNVDEYGYEVAKDAWEDLKAIGIEVSEPQRTLSDYTPFQYEGITYYIEDDEDITDNPLAYNEKLEEVGRVGEESIRRGEYEINFKNDEFEEIHNTMRD